MKPVISLAILLMSSLLTGALAVAECTSNRNPNISITKPDSLYSDHGDGTITDKQTGLMWQKCSLGLSDSLCATGTALSFTWQAALAVANDNTDSGYSDWRLPNKNELESLLDDACFQPAINETVFPNTIATGYWSSSPYVGNSGETSWVIGFNDSGVRITRKLAALSVRLVRGSQ